MNFARTRRAEVVVDVTPLIDIIFQLVLFFMVSTTFVNAPGIEVDLPKSSSDTILRDQDDVNLWVTSDGAVFLDEAPVSWDALKAALAGAASANPGTMVIIKADREVDHGRVVAVMDLARGLGLNRLAIATEVSGADGGEGAAD